MVGCKILCEEKLVHDALTDGFWPRGIRCRRWNETPPSNRRGQPEFKPEFKAARTLDNQQRVFVSDVGVRAVYYNSKYSSTNSKYSNGIVYSDISSSEEDTEDKDEVVYDDAIDDVCAW